MAISDATQGLIDLAADVSHDEDEQDWYDVDEYIDTLPNTTRVLREFVRFIHEEYL